MPEPTKLRELLDRLDTLCAVPINVAFEDWCDSLSTDDYRDIRDAASLLRRAEPELQTLLEIAESHYSSRANEVVAKRVRSILNAEADTESKEERP